MQCVTCLVCPRSFSRTLQRLGVLYDRRAALVRQARSYKAGREVRQEAASVPQREPNSRVPSWAELSSRTTNQKRSGDIDGRSSNHRHEAVVPSPNTSRTQQPQTNDHGQANAEEILNGRTPSFVSEIVPENYLRVRTGNNRVRRFDPVLLRDSCRSYFTFIDRVPDICVANT